MSTPTKIANADLAKALQDHEDLVLSETTNLEATDLSKKLFQRSVISDSMMDQFSSLDHNRVEPQLQLRYLLRLVTQRVQKDSSVWDKFLVLLEELGERSLCEYLRKTSSGEEQPEPKKMRLDLTFSMKDIQWILEEIAEVSPKWKMLGIALGLPTYKVENIKGDDNMTNLWEIIKVWLSGDSNTPPTISILAQALRSKIVDKGKLAKEVEEKFILHKESKSASSSAYTDTWTSSLNFIIKQSDRVVEVEDGKSTLLLVQASQRENVSYQWNKNGQLLADTTTEISLPPTPEDSAPYSGVHDNLLVINHAHQGTGGEYTCCVKCQEKEELSNKFTVIVLYLPEKKILLDLYSKNTEVPLNEDWPPVGTKTFINLALTSKSIGPVRGDPDIVLNKSQTIQYKEVFNPYQSAARILVEGRPGSGKTTLVGKLIKDWRQGKVLLEASMVFLVSLRTLGKTPSQSASISNVLQNFYSNQKDLADVISKVEKNNGEGVCFVFDGLDEYHPHEECNSVVFQLLNKKYLPLAMIIVSSRPGAMDRLRQEYVTMKIEVFGFTKDQISEYIDSFPFGVLSDNAYGPRDLKKYLKVHQNIFYMCYLPIHVAIICFVYKIERGHLPNTQSKIYEEFTRSMILRHLKRKNKDVKLKSLKALKGCYEKYFSKLCCLAFSMTLDNKQIIDEDDLQDFQLLDTTISPGDWSLSLVTGNRTEQLCGISTSYTFLHLTLQEFLAAYYIVITKGKMQKRELIERVKHNSSTLSNIWTYYFGLETFESESELSIFNNFFTIEPTALAKTETVPLSNTQRITNIYKLAHESQQPILCDQILRSTGGIINRKSVHPSDVPALVYVICNTSQPIELELSFQQYFDVDHVLQQLQNKKFLELKAFILVSCIGDRSTFQYLSNILKSCSQLRKLGLYECDLKGDNLYLAEKLPHLYNLVSLKISRSHFTHRNNKPFSYAIGSCCDIINFRANYSILLKSLSLKTAKERNTQLLAFIEQLHWLTQIKNLDLSYWKLDLKCCKSLASNIRHLYNLEYLDVSCNGISFESTIILASALHNLPNLKILDMSGNSISHIGITSLASGLHNLTILDVSDNYICSDGAISLATELHHLSKLTVLNLGRNNIGSDGAISLASQLHHLTSLEILCLADNGINPHSAIQIITALKDCKKLSYVMLNESQMLDQLIYKHGFILADTVRDDDTDTIESVIAAIRQHKIDADIRLRSKTIRVIHNTESTQDHVRQTSRLCNDLPQN